MATSRIWVTRAASLGIAVVLWACTGDGGTGASGNSGAGTGGPAGSGSGGGGQGGEGQGGEGQGGSGEGGSTAGDCGAVPSCYICAECTTQSSCEAEYSACSEVPDCLALYACWDNCGPDAACYEDCKVLYAAGVPAWNPLRACIGQVCSTCGG